MAHLPVPALSPGAWLGVLGGGQLGRMFCTAAQTLGYRVCVLDPDTSSPAGAIADRHIQAQYLDSVALDEMAGLCSAITTEFENVPAAALGGDRAGPHGRKIVHGELRAAGGALSRDSRP